MARHRSGRPRRRRIASHLRFREPTIRRSGTHTVVIALVVALLSASAPGAASATSLASQLRTKRKQAAALQQKLAATRPLLMKALARVDAVDADLQDVRSQMLDTESTIQSLQDQITSGETALNDRAVAMYTSGGLDMLEAILSVRSLDDLLTRMDMLSYIQESDARMVAELTTSRDQTAFLQGQQAIRENRLVALRQEADARKAVVEALIGQQESALRSVGSDIDRIVASQETAAAAAAAAASGSGGVPDPPVAFDPNNLVSSATFADAGSMSAEAIQAFLDTQPGSLRSLSAKDHNGVTRTAAQMIADASTAWGVNPKVIIVTLQKEQSLVSDASPSSRALDWAMGCGKMDGSTLTKYRGFGNQIWGGARALARNRSYWSPGLSLSIDGNAVYPANPATHALYRYTPHLHGNVMFWRLYWRYFGDPNA